MSANPNLGPEIVYVPVRTLTVGDTLVSGDHAGVVTAVEHLSRKQSAARYGVPEFTVGCPALILVTVEGVELEFQAQESVEVFAR